MTRRSRYRPDASEHNTPTTAGRALIGALAALGLQAASASVLEGVSAEQVERGRAVYAGHCATCHAATLRGTAHGNALTGRMFIDKWGPRDSGQLLAYTRAAMPPGETGSLDPAQYKAVVAYVLAANADSAAADLPLLASAGQLQVEASGDSDWVSWSAASTIDAAAKSSGGFTGRKLENFRPVTKRMLADPPPADWLSWRRSLDGQGYSPLEQINTDTIGRLRLAWSLAMHEGSNQVTPLVHDGIMFLTHPGNIIQALDAANGDLIWEYRYPFPEAARTLGGPTRNIALYGDKLYLATYDAAIVALDARSGEMVWRTEKADYRKGYTHTAGPVIGDGIVLSGINGCEWYKRGGCFITGHDAETGRELWRTQTVAQPGQPGGDTWAGLPAELRAGGDAWIAGSYDPELELFFIGTSQAKPWVAASRGMSPKDRALYTNSTLAIEPRSGRLRWHFQHIPGETIDMEVGFERILIDGNDRKLLYTIGKDGILWKLDRETGEYIDLVETLPQTIYQSVDRDTGRVRYREDIVSADIGDTVTACPGIYGGHNWQASAYDPQTRHLIIPLHQLCSEMIGRRVDSGIGGGGYGGESRTYPMPGKAGKMGRLTAIDLRDMSEAWTHEQQALFLTGALTTGGGLVFVGDLDRYFSAFDVATGEQLWRTRLGAPLHGYPISYSVGGKQYIAVPTGIGVFRALTAVLSPEIYQPTGGQALYVFELGESE